jgi:hypothetical protein
MALAAYSIDCFSIATDLDRKNLLSKNTSVDAVRVILYRSVEGSWYFRWQSLCFTVFAGIFGLVGIYLGKRSPKD